jgi:hypothetical protein
VNPATVQLVIELAALAAKLAIEVKQQSGLSDDALLEQASQKNADTAAAVKAFLEAHK